MITLRALESLGKSQSLIADKHDVSGDIRHHFNFSGLSDEDLDEEISKYNGE